MWISLTVTKVIAQQNLSGYLETGDILFKNAFWVKADQFWGLLHCPCFSGEYIQYWISDVSDSCEFREGMLSW